jgi:hypothetical protein
MGDVLLRSFSKVKRKITENGSFNSSSSFLQRRLLIEISYQFLRKQWLSATVLTKAGQKGVDQAEDITIQ